MDEGKHHFHRTKAKQPNRCRHSAKITTSPEQARLHQRMHPQMHERKKIKKRPARLRKPCGACPISIPEKHKRSERLYYTTPRTKSKLILQPPENLLTMGLSHAIIRSWLRDSRRNREHGEERRNYERANDRSSTRFSVKNDS